MIMFGLALRSLRYRTSAFVASLVSIFLGAIILMAFASLIDVAGGSGVSSADKSSLTTIGAVVGGWGLVIVAFGVGSTLQLAIHQRATEVALLKATGATPPQVTRMIVGEGLLVAIVGSVLAIVPGLLAGRAVLQALISTNQIANGTEPRAGAATFGIGLGVTFAAAIVASLITARRAASIMTRQALVAAAGEEQTVGKKRIIFGSLLLLVAVYCVVLAGTLLKDNGYVTLSVAGQACIWASIGLALLAPVLVRVLSPLVSGPIKAFGGAGCELAHVNTRQRSGQLATTVLQVILLTGIAVGTFAMQRVHNAANPATTAASAADDKGVQTLNVVILAMLVVFVAVILINSSITTMTYRRREFAQLRLAGATPGQVRSMVVAESVIAIVAGLALGTVAALVGVIPYSMSQNHHMLPGGFWWIYAVVAAGVVILTLVTNLAAAARAIRVPALVAIA